MLSIPSCLSVDWASAFCRVFRHARSTVPIIAGGQWVTDSGSEWLSRRIPELDLITFGYAEDRILGLARQDEWSSIPGTSLSARSDFLRQSVPSWAPPLDYDLLPDFRMHHPSIEAARGCGMTCSFCPSSSQGPVQMKAATQVLQEIGLCQAHYGEPIKAYLEAPLFAPSHEWVREFAESWDAAGADGCQWRCESRADVLSAHSIHLLSHAGLKVLDVGLESASPQQLTRLSKTRVPRKYLASASELLRACSDHGVWVRVSVKLVAGETADTVAQTVEWLDRHRSLVNAWLHRH